MADSFATIHRKLELVDTCTPDLLPTDTGVAQQFWAMDEILRVEFSGLLQMHEQGLIHSMELVRGLNEIVNRPR